MQIHILAAYAINLSLYRKAGKDFQGKDGWLINAVCVAGGLLPLGREGGWGEVKRELTKCEKGVEGKQLSEPQKYTPIFLHLVTKKNV